MEENVGANGGKKVPAVSATPVSKVVTILLVRAFLPLKIGQGVG
jgi:hypothetical protein